MNKKALIPSGISSLRIAALPLFLYFFGTGALALCSIIITLSVGTDLLDGYVARKLKVASKLGAYYDAGTDFILITGIFTVFTLSNYYSVWMLILIAASFSQFVLSSLYTEKIYDPLGKYFGSALYLGIALTLVFPFQAMFTFVEYSFLVFALTSFITRTVNLTNIHRKHLIIKEKAYQHQKRTQTTN